MDDEIAGSRADVDVVRKAEVKVPTDREGKEYKLELEGEWVEIAEPITLRTTRMNINSLKRAVDELHAISQGA